MGFAKANLDHERPLTISVDETRNSGNNLVDVSGFVIQVISDPLRISCGMFDSPVATAVPDGPKNLWDGLLPGVEVPHEIPVRKPHRSVCMWVTAGRQTGATG